MTDAKDTPPVECADRAMARKIQAAVATLNELRSEAAAAGLTVKFATLPLMTLARGTEDMLTVKISRNITL